MYENMRNNKTRGEIHVRSNVFLNSQKIQFIPNTEGSVSRLYIRTITCPISITAQSIESKIIKLKINERKQMIKGGIKKKTDKDIKPQVKKPKK